MNWEWRSPGLTTYHYVMDDPSTLPARRLNLVGATLVGVGAMVGAGIFVLCGVAMDRAGPAALLAFTLNGVLSLITAASFAELSSAFPESGGSYVFARKVFPIGGAFAAGWVLWFAYVAACALYSLGFASFLGFALREGLGMSLASWFEPVVGAATALVSLWILAKKGAGAGNWISVAKMVAFLILIVAGLVVLATRPAGTAERSLTPFLPHGITGVFMAMGFTFIALEGFEIIAAIGEEVQAPEKTIPRAMFLSIGITMVVYTGLLFVVLTVGGTPGGPPAWQVLGRSGDSAMAVAAGNYLGVVGSVVVVAAGLLSTFSALAATMLAASRVSFSMARDRALPRSLSKLGGDSGSPQVALIVSGVLVVLVILVTGNVEVTGAAASLIFLVSFGLTNAAGLLVRLRSGALATFRAPFYPALPILGITACLGLAVFQAVVVPAASLVVIVWLALGALLYRFSFGARARTVSARAEAWDSELVKLRGRTPLVLVPMANPERAEPLLRFAYALATPGRGRVHALTVARFDPGRDSAEDGEAAYVRAEAVVRHAVATACRMGKAFEGAVLLAPDVTDAIARVAAERHPETVLVGMSNMGEGGGSDLLSEILARTTADVVVLNAPPAWTLDGVERILVPVAGRAPHDPLRARLLGSLLREGGRTATLLRILRGDEDRAAAERDLRHRAEDLGLPFDACRIESQVDPIEAITRHSATADLLLLGFGSRTGRRRLVGGFALRLVAASKCPVVAIAESIART
jgi:basic amino acid/polyamine antiporter, APA family